MGLLGKFKKRVNSPMFLRMKRKRSAEALTLASTCDFTETETFDAIGTSSSQREEPIRDMPLCTKYEALEEDENELLSPTDLKTHDRHFFSTETEMKTTNIVEDEENPKETLCAEETKTVDDASLHEKEETISIEGKKTVDAPRYVSSSSEDEDDPSLSSREVQKKKKEDQRDPSQIKKPNNTWSTATTATDSLANLYSKHKDDDSSDGSEVLSHIYHDELSTLYEVPTDREDNDSVMSSTSMSDLEDILGGLRVSKKRRGQSNNTVDDSIIRARWDYALNMMCSNSPLFFNNAAKTEKDDMCGPDMAEI